MMFLLISIKNKTKYVVLLHFYVSILKKHKITRLNKIKKDLVEHFYHEISNYR